MHRRTILLAGAALLIAPGAGAESWLKKGAEVLKGLGGGGGGGGLGLDEITRGLKEALTVGTGRVVKNLGRKDGFNADPAIHIPLPKSMRKVRKALKPFGMAGQLDDLEVRLNRAAEVATPKARRIFVDAITSMTLDDARKIYDGPDDAATRYFQGRMTKPLRGEMRPVVSDSLSEVGAIRRYDDVMRDYRRLPFVPDVKANLINHVLKLGLDGIFHYVAMEEAAIRNNPAKRSTELLQKVFGG